MNTACRTCSCKLEDLCRVCGYRVNKGSKAVRKQAGVSAQLERHSSAYKCTIFTEELLTAFHFDVSQDCPEIHPPMFCSKCQLVLSRKVAAQKEKRPYKCLVKPYDWFRWGVEECKGCMPFYNDRWPKHRPYNGNSPAEIVEHIMAVSPPAIIKNPIQPPLAATQTLSVMSELECSICLGVLTQPMQLPCGNLVCATCLVKWIHLCAARCPCCHSNAPLECKDVNPASSLIQQLLHDVMVVCGTCKSSVKAISYDSHCCSTVQRQEMQLVHKVLHQMLNANKENTIQIQTGGTPLKLIHVTTPRAPLSELSARTRKRRVHELQTTRSILSAGAEDADTMFEDELRCLSEERKEKVLHEAGITVDIPPMQGLAIKSMLGIPWYRLRILNRWLKQAGVYLGSERKQRALSKELVGDNLTVELAPFSFKLANGGEELRGAAMAYTPSLTRKVIQLLEQNDMEGTLTWHHGTIPQNEIWLKLGGDKGGGYFKMNFQIVNTQTPNSVNNTCVFSCFEASDTVSNLHVALDRYRGEVANLCSMKWKDYKFKLFLSGDYEFLSRIYGLSGASGKQPCVLCLITLDQLQTPLATRGPCAHRTLDSMLLDHQRFMEEGRGNLKKAQLYNNCIEFPFFNIPLSQVCIPGLHVTQGIFQKIFALFQDACHELDLKLAVHCRGNQLNSSEYEGYCSLLRDLSTATNELERLLEEEETIQQVATYYSVVDGTNPSLAKGLLELSSTCHTNVEVLENRISAIRHAVTKGFNIDEGPCIKCIEKCLNDIGVCHQRYYGGIFVGNHVHTILKPANVEALCSCVKKVTQDTPIMTDANNVHSKFHTILTQFSECHSLYDCTTIKPDTILRLDDAIKKFFATLDCTFGVVKRTVKMHLLEDHMVEWITAHQAGCGLMGEQGAESIHAKFNSLIRTYSGIRNPTAKLRSIMNEHYLNISPHISAAVPPPPARKRKLI